MRRLRRTLHYGLVREFLQPSLRSDFLSMAADSDSSGRDWPLNEIADEHGRDALKSDVVGQRCAGCDYITFNGLPTLERKARLAGAWGAGVMVWEIDQDLPGNRAIRTVRRALDEGRKYAR